MDDENPYAAPQSSAAPRDAPHSEPGEPPRPPRDMVKLTSYATISEALLCQSVLRGHGIESYLENEGGAGAGLQWVNSVRGIEIVVATEDAQSAATLLAEVNEQLQQGAQAAPITFACEECGAEITFPGERRGQVETCPKCYEYVDVPD